MKTTFKYLAMAVVALMSMSACNNDLDEQVPNKDYQPVHFIMTVNGTNASTRTTTDPATRETTWKENDEIGIFAYKKGTNELIKANAKYVLTGEIWKAATTADEISSADVYDYFAYYPYQAGATDPKAINISAKKDQSATSGDDYANSDVLAAQNKAVTDASTVALTFNHVFAMVEVQVKGDKVTKQPTKVELQGINAAATLDLTAATPAAAVSGTTTGTINMFYLGATNNIHSYRAVIPTQIITASEPLVSIFAPDADGKTYNMKYSADVTYEAGKYRQLVVNIGTPQASLTIPATSMTINPWGESTEIPGQGEEIETPVVPVTTFTLSFPTNPDTDITAEHKLKGWANVKLADSNTAFWFRRENGNTDISTIGYDVANTALTLKVSPSIVENKVTNKASWNNSNIGYHCIETFERTYYKVTIVAQSSTDNGSCGIAISNNDDTKFFKVASKDSFEAKVSGTVRAASINTTETTLVNFFDFSYGLNNGASASSTTPVEGYTATVDSDVKHINIYLYNYYGNTSNTGENTLTIKSVIIEKYTPAG